MDEQGLFPEAQQRNRLSGLTQRLSYFGAQECERFNGRWAWNRLEVVRPTPRSSNS